MYKIEKGVPKPNGKMKYQFGDMEIGDSFYAHDKNRQQLGSASYMYARKYAPSMKFAARTEGKGARIWRIA